jgi:hypothetical protein
MSNKVVSPARALDSDEQCGEYSPRAHGDERPQRPAQLVAEH